MVLGQCARPDLSTPSLGITGSLGKPTNGAMRGGHNLSTPSLGITLHLLKIRARVPTVFQLPLSGSHEHDDADDGRLNTLSTPSLGITGAPTAYEIRLP